MNKKIIPICVLSTSIAFGSAVYAEGIQFRTGTETTANTNSDSKIDVTLGDGFTFDIVNQKNTMYYQIANNMTGEITEKNSDILKNYISKFADFNGDEWFADDVLLPMYFNVLTGYTDGTLKPSDSITSAEVAKVISATFEDGISNGSKKWYDMYYKYCAKAFTYDSYGKMGGNYDDYMSNHQMTRAEIAFVIANYVDGGSGELQSYISSAKQGNLGSLARFSDCGNLATDDDSTIENDLRIMNAGWIPSRYAGALAFLVDKGVFMGNSDGTMSPISPVSRAEVFALLNRVCTATPSYTSGQFKGDSSSINNADVKDKPNTSTSKGDPGWASGKTADYNAWQSRPAATLNLTDGHRDRAKVGDTVVTADGTSYLLEGSGIYVGDTEVAGVGLPVAADLGRLNERGVPLKDRDIPDTHEYGCISSDVSTGGCKYIVFSKTGEGHWDVEWNAIQRATEPTEPGTEGQISDNGYFQYFSDLGWCWLVR